MEIVFTPAGKQHELGPHQSGKVQAELRAKKEQDVVPAKLKSASELPKEGNGKVSPREEAPAPFLLELQCLPAYHNPMLPPERTPRQRIMELLIGARLTSHQLAQMLGIAERQVEEHLVHAVKSIARDKTRRFILEPSRCPDCDFVFHDRRRFTRPSRCPRCRGEGITAPRYGIESVGSRSGRVDSNASSW
jgi:predicted Zn-ribbon and HTH transcriptional regulator